MNQNKNLESTKQSDKKAKIQRRVKTNKFIDFTFEGLLRF